MLETFELISVVILGFQINRKGNAAFSFNHLILGKLKRLILPLLIFGALYLLIFLDLSSAPRAVIKSLFEGVSGTCGSFQCCLGVFLQCS